jgi:P27 family predicted phage terminase small subunit
MRPAVPTALKVVKGEREDRVNRSEPVPAGEVVKPGRLAGEAERLWDELAPSLVRKGVLTAWDVPAFAEACRWWALYQDALGRVESEGLIVEGAKGERKHPAFQVARDAWDKFAQVAGKFGLTPSERSRLSVGEGSRDGRDRLLS